MPQFYRLNVFLAETSATAGGLGSLPDPVGPIKQAQQLPGQVTSADVIAFLRELGTREVHGYRRETGYWVLTRAALDSDEAT
jgi:arginine/lysine/ornithine decarboxylase